MAFLPTTSESPLVYACELWVFAMCPALRGSTVSYARDAHFPKHSLEYSLNFWSWSKKKKETRPSQSASAWYGKVKPRVCTPNPTPQVLQQQVMYKPRNQSRAKVKAPTTAIQEHDKEYHKILQRQDSYHTKVKVLKYLEFTHNTIGHQKVMERLSAPKIKYQTTRIMQEAQDMHNNGCQNVLRDRHYDGIWYGRVSRWLHCMEKIYQEWLHEADLSYHFLGLRHTLIQKGLQRREEA